MCNQKLFIIGLLFSIIMSCAGTNNGEQFDKTIKVIGVPGLSEKEIMEKLDCKNTEIQEWLNLSSEQKQATLFAAYIEDVDRLKMATSPSTDLIEITKTENMKLRLKAWTWPASGRRALIIEMLQKVKEAEAFRQRLVETIKELKKPPQPEPLPRSAAIISSATLQVDFVIQMANKDKFRAMEQGFNQLINSSDISFITTTNNQQFETAMSKALQTGQQGVYVIY